MSITQYTYTIEKCTYCGQPHDYQLNVEKLVPVFGGPGDVEKPRQNEWVFTCPNSQKVFSTEVKLPKGLKMMGVASLGNDPVTPASVQPKQAPTPTPEFQAWINESRTRGITFSTSMLTTSTGAIGIYFAIEKYLGVDKATSGLGLFGVLPPVLYLLASLLFILALRPKLQTLASSDFEAFRNKTLENINRFITFGLIAFLCASFSAVMHFFMLIA